MFLQDYDFLPSISVSLVRCSPKCLRIRVVLLVLVMGKLIGVAH